MKTWAKSQSEYLLDKNPLHQSYMNGFTTKYCTEPHHAAAHASLTGTVDDPVSNRHILWGALVNGPTDMSDNHSDARGDYTANEVTIDYNAAFLAAIAANYATLGSNHCPIPNFPPEEVRNDEFYTSSAAPTTNRCVSQLAITMVNESIHPPRYNEALVARFYIDVSELVAAGIDPKTLSVRKVSDIAGKGVGSAVLTGPFPCRANSNLWYVNISFEGAQFWGANSSLFAPRTVVLEYGTGTSASCVWNPNNDYSTQTLVGTGTVKNTHVPVYSNGTLVYGNAPTCDG